MRISNVIHAVDTHVGGEPGRVIVGGVLDVPGNTMFEKMVYLSTMCGPSLRIELASYGLELSMVGSLDTMARAFPSSPRRTD